MKKLDAFFSGLAWEWMHGDASEIAARYSHPLALYVNGEIRIEASREATRDAILRRRRAARAAGAVRVETSILDVGDRSQTRFPVDVRWVFLDATGREIDTSHIRYFVSENASGSISIEILEFIRQAFPQP